MGYKLGRFKIKNYGFVTFSVKSRTCAPPESGNGQTGKITADISHPGPNLFQCLLTGRCYRTLYTKTTRAKNSFFPHTSHLNTQIRR